MSQATDLRKELFLKDLFELYAKHQLSIGHEDHHGSFILEENPDDIVANIEWMIAAYMQEER